MPYLVFMTAEAVLTFFFSSSYQHVPFKYLQLKLLQTSEVNKLLCRSQGCQIIISFHKRNLETQ